jgi:hypothetical protein
VGWLVGVTGFDERCLTGEIVGSKVGMFLLGFCVDCFDGNGVLTFVGVRLPSDVGRFVDVIDGSLVGRCVCIFVIGIIAGSFVGSLIEGLIILVGALVCPLDGRPVNDGSVGRVDGKLVVGSFVGALVGSPSTTVGVSVRDGFLVVDLFVGELVLGIKLGLGVFCS